MKHVVWMTMLALSLTAGSIGCGDDDDDAGTEEETDNVGACENWKETVTCEGADLSLLEQLDCDTYAQTACDISAYFDCLSDNTTCSGTFLDVSGWTGCQNLVTCQ